MLPKPGRYSREPRHDRPPGNSDLPRQGLTGTHFPPEVLELVARFELHHESYLHPTYKETRARVEFIDPFFEALGWDVHNKAGNAEAYKDVIHADALTIDGESKEPDYCFRAGTTRKFYVEAKKPAESVRDSADHAYQLRRYAWNAKLPLSILTNFRELAVYDCRVKPSKTDASAVARVMYVTLDEYATRWAEIAGRFSKDAIYKGLFDKFADTSKSKRGTTEVDTAFLHEIEQWRTLLAQNIALRNKALTRRELNHAVQATIDRLIFLRICEARGIEEYGSLRDIGQASNSYPALTRLFRRADDKYNSGLFHFKRERGRPQEPDEMTLSLSIDDKPLKSIIRRLYYPESPYEFAVLPADILGQVYEQFLGKVITLTAGHRARVEDKPEVKKAGGVYYTPTYIVRYIVENTLQPLLADATPRKVAKLRILDPACGSGSFLIQVYQFLLDWHLDWYANDGPDKHKKLVYRDERGAWRLSTAEKKRILLSNVFGVDIDPQAVETTKLSLLLKVLESETSESVNAQLTLVHERALPDLDLNIRCGNTLVEPDDAPPQLNLLDIEEVLRLNAFSWLDEFPQVMAQGGFDAIVGNPPYLGIEHTSDDDKAIFAKKYKTLLRRFDVFGLFIERALHLLRDGGLFGMIVPSTMLNNFTFSALRQLLVEETHVRSVVNLGGRVFAGANNDTMILLFAKEHPRDEETTVFDVREYGRGLTSAELGGTVRLAQAATPPEYTFELRVSDEVDSLLRTMQGGNPTLGELCGCFQGLISGNNAAFIVEPATAQEQSLETKCCKPIVFGDGVSRYAPPRADAVVLYLTRDSRLDDMPHIAARINSFRAELSSSTEVRAGSHPWYALHRPRVQAHFELQEKLLVQEIRNLALKRRVVAALDDCRLYADHTLNVLYAKSEDYSLRYILGVLNSALINFIFGRRHIDIHIKNAYLKGLPIPHIDLDKKESREQHDKMVQMVDSMLKLNQKRLEAATEHERAVLQREIANVDRRIDSLVFDLFGLDDAEIAFVKQAIAD